MSYGLWSEPIAEERGIGMSRHNISVKRSALEQIGDLEANMSRGGNLVGELERTPGGVCVASGVVVAHENFSRLVPTIGLRVQAGRLAAARRADRENWSAMRRLVYVLASPLIPLMRARVLMRKVIVPATHTSRAKRAAGLAVGCVLDAIGQAAGFAVGEGRVAENLAAFEFGRERFITKDDQSRLDLEYAHR